MTTYRELFGEPIERLLHDKAKEDLLAFIDAQDMRERLFDVLNDDFLAAYKARVENTDSQFLSRTFIRTSFATIEGLVNSLNQTLLAAHKGGFTKLTPDENNILAEQSRTKKGELRPKFLSLESKVRSSFSLFALKTCGVEFTIDDSPREWKQFISAIEIRNHLMHPRFLEDIQIGEKQITLVFEATMWFLGQYTALQRTTGDMLHKQSLENLIKGRIKGMLSGK